MAVKTINIAFPFEKSPVGNFLRLNRTSKNAIKSDITHLLLTRKGERLYNNEFGSGLYRFLEFNSYILFFILIFFGLISSIFVFMLGLKRQYDEIEKTKKFKLPENKLLI